MKLEFGSYVQILDAVGPTNTNRARTFGAITLLPTCNAHGDYYFLSIATDARVSRHRWHELPIPDTAIARVEALAKAEKQPLIQDTGLLVEWRHDQPIDDDEYDRDLEPDDPPMEPLPADFDAVDATELDDLHADGGFAAAPPFVPPVVPPHAAQGALEDPQLAEYIVEVIDEGAQHPGADGAHGFADLAVIEEEMHDADDAGADAGADAPDQDFGPDAGADTFDQDLGGDDAEADALDQDFYEDPLAEFDEQEREDTDDIEAPMLPRYNLRNRTNPNNDAFRAAMDSPYDSKSYFPPVPLLQKDIFAYVMAQMEVNPEFVVTMTQMSANAGLKKHGKKAEEALLAESSQLEDLNVYEPLDPNKLTRAQKKAALRAINLIKETRCGRLKGRTAADGRPQRNMYDKSETASPTVGTDALMVSIIVDAHKRRDVATADIAGAYHKAYMKDFTVMKFTGASVDILCKMNSKYIPFVTVEGGIKVLYVQLIKAIYGCVQSALLWYKMFHQHLKHLGLSSIHTTHASRTRTSTGNNVPLPGMSTIQKCHMPSRQWSLAQIEERFGKITVNRGKEHVFLGTNIRYMPNGTAEITFFLG